MHDSKFFVLPTTVASCGRCLLNDLFFLNIGLYPCMCNRWFCCGNADRDLPFTETGEAEIACTRFELCKQRYCCVPFHGSAALSYIQRTSWQLIIAIATQCAMSLAAAIAPRCFAPNFNAKWNTSQTLTIFRLIGFRSSSVCCNTSVYQNFSVFAIAFYSNTDYTVGEDTCSSKILPW